MRLTLGIALLVFSGPAAHAQTQPAPIDIPNAPIPIQVLVQIPADTNTDLQAICLFRSSPLNTLHGSLVEANEKLKELDQLKSEFLNTVSHELRTAILATLAPAR